MPRTYANQQADEQDRFHWAVGQLAQLGFPEEDAEALALAGVDWHDAAKLIERGCPVHLAVCILL